MPRERINETETSAVIKLKGDNYQAYIDFESSMRKCGKYKSVDDTLNKIIQQWRTKIPAVFRGYERP